MDDGGAVFTISRAVMASTRIRSPEKAVYQVVATIHAETGEFPAPDAIARSVGGTIDGVVKALRTLCDAGLIQDTARGMRVLPVPESYFLSAGMTPPALISPEPVLSRPKPINSTTVEGWFQSAMTDRWGPETVVGRWGPKERSLALRMVKEYGPTLLKEAVFAYVRGSVRPPVLIGLWYDRERWVGHVRETLFGRRTPQAVLRTPRARDDEYTAEAGAGDMSLGLLK